MKMRIGDRYRTILRWKEEVKDMGRREVEEEVKDMDRAG
jgi:hypothetical protein